MTYTIYLIYAIALKLFYKEYLQFSDILGLFKESLEILTYYFYINYTTKAIGFDTTEHKSLYGIIRMCLIFILIYVFGNLLGNILVTNFSNAYLFVGIRIIIFSLAIVMFYKSIKIKNNLILRYIQFASFVYFLFGLTSFVMYFFQGSNDVFLPYHYILVGTLIDFVVFSIAMSKRLRNQIVFAEKLASDKELEIQSIKYKQELEVKEQIEKDRKQIAMDLHDDIGASLSSILINSELAEKFSHETSLQNKQFLRNIANQSKEINSKLSDFIWSIKFELGNNNSLKQRLLDYQQHLFDGKNINCHYQIDESLLENAPIITKNILLIIKEAMNNIAKYALASEVDIQLYKDNGYLILKIKDNGIGFEKKSVLKGNGLENMKRRCSSSFGQFIVTSEKNIGTEIICKWPMIT